MKSNKSLIFLTALLLLLVGVMGIISVPPKTTFQYQLNGVVDTTVSAQVFFIDLFDGIKTGVIKQLKSMNKIVFCYYSAGSYENFRPDASDFPKAIIAGAYAGFPDEWWLDITNFKTSGLATIMQKRMDLAAANQCDGVDPDNINVYLNSADSKINISYQQQLDFNNFLANYAHSKGLAVSLKNDGSQATDLVSSFDCAVCESCYEYSETAYLDLFIQQKKAVFGISYQNLFPSQTKNWKNTTCADSLTKSYTWILKDSSLLAPLAECGTNFVDTLLANSNVLYPLSWMILYLVYLIM